MGYLAAWKVLEEMVTDLRRRGVTVPADVIGNLRSAKTLINVLKVDPNCMNTDQKVEEHLFCVESYLVSEGEKLFEKGYVEEWLGRLDEARRKVFDEEEGETRFVTGIPREQKWIRVKPSDNLPLNKMRTLADESNLTCNLQNDGCLLVYGEEEHIKDFIKKMAAKHRSEAEK